MPLLRATQIPSQHGGASRSEPPHAKALRAGLAASGGLLALASVWLLATELLRTAPSPLVWNREQAGSAAAGSAGAGQVGAGYVGMIRGEVWLEDGLASWTEFLAKGGNGSPDTETFAAARAALARAVRLAPHDARAWLVLAAAETRVKAPPDAIAGALKMSYYTGSNEVALIPLRIGLAAEPNLGDAELRILLENEIRTIAQQASLRPSLAQAYRYASADAQRALREIVGGIDARLASEMQAVR